MNRRLVPLALAAALAASLHVVPAAGADAADAEGQWLQVRYPAPVGAAERRALADAGAAAVQYAPVDTYVAWAEPGALRGLSGVTVTPLAAADKIDPGLADARGPTRTQVLTYAPATGDGLASIGVVLNPHAADPDGDLQSQTVILASHTDVPRVAELPEVLYAGPAATELQSEDEGTAQIVAGNIEGGRPVPGYMDFLGERDLDGSGVTLSIVDTGIDDRHPDLADRVVARYHYSQSGLQVCGPVVGCVVDGLPQGEPIDSLGHGTHVASIAAGAATDLPGLGTATDEEGFAYGVGIAPGAWLVDQAPLAATGGSWPPPGGWETLSRDAIDGGAVAWNASWHSGEGTGAGYIASARAMDIITRDADSTRPGNQPLTLVFSAGNEGPGARTMTAPKEAKNIITVGSTRSQRAGGIDAVSSFSSRGPAADGRILPTVVAPGELVAAARALAPVPFCNLIDTWTLDPLPADGYGLYAYCSGTSMAAPHVAGAVALVHQWWRDGFDGADPSPAMSKALLVNTATPLAGTFIPDNHQGWGRVDLGNLFDDAEERVYVDQEVVFTDRDDSHQVLIEPADPDRPLKATLVWSDAPGVPGANPALVNDLDLTVTEVLDDGEVGDVFRGNVFNRGWSIAGGFPDRFNNVENVFVEEPDGRYRVSMSAFRLPGQAIFGPGEGPNQDFALVISNARELVETQGTE